MATRLSSRKKKKIDYRKLLRGWRTGNNRLITLSELLEIDAATETGIRFDFNSWGHVDADNPMSCGTDACAFGLAAISGVFRKQGLRYKIPNGCMGATIEIGLKQSNGRIAWSPADAGTKLFYISDYDFSHLFAGEQGLSCATGAVAEIEVAHRIRDYVNVRKLHSKIIAALGERKEMTALRIAEEVGMTGAAMAGHFTKQLWRLEKKGFITPTEHGYRRV